MTWFWLGKLPVLHDMGKLPVLHDMVWLGKLPVLYDRVLAGIINKLKTFKAKTEVLHTG